MAYDIHKFRRGRSSDFSQIPPQKICEWIERHFEFKKRKGGLEYVINNPFVHDTGYHFNISVEKGVCHDWRGDSLWAGPVNPRTGKRNCSFIQLVKLYKKCSYREALQDVLGDSQELDLLLRPESRIIEPEEKRLIQVQLPPGTRLLSNSQDLQARALTIWLGSRGYTLEDIANSELYHLGMDVYWPYFEFESLVYWQSRSRLHKRFEFPSLEVRDETGKIIGKTEGSKSDFLYGFDGVEPASYLTLTEAIFDKHMLGPQALASGGAVLTSRQISKIQILGPQQGVILSPDNDVAGLESVVANYRMLAPKGYKIFYSLPPTSFEGKSIKDWNELFTEAGLSIPEIQKIHGDGVKLLNSSAVNKLISKITYLKKYKNYLS